MTAEVEPLADCGGARRLGDRYDLGPVLGTGASSEVRSGWDGRLDRPVAIKLLRPELVGDPLVRRRFAEEARAAARLSHPNIVAVFDTGDPALSGSPSTAPPFIVMEHLGGETLGTALEGGPLPVAEVRSVAEQILSALQAGAKAGVVHCDIKPGNILAAGDGRWKLGDFGIASSVGCARPDDTQADMVMGTPAYLAPERLCGQPATECSDLFALGVVLYEALTGVRPYRSMQSFPWSTALAGEPAQPVRSLRPDVDPVLAAVVDRAIMLDPMDRFSSAEEIGAALRGAGAPPAPSRRRHSPLTLRRIVTGTVASAAALAASLLVVTAGGPAHPGPAGSGASPHAPPTVPTGPPSPAVPALPLVAAASATPAHLGPGHHAAAKGPAKESRGPNTPPPAPARRPHPSDHPAGGKH